MDIHKKVLARLDNSQKSEMTPLPQQHCVGSNTNEIFFVKNVFFDKCGKNGDIADKQMSFNGNNLSSHMFEEIGDCTRTCSNGSTKKFDGAVSKMH